jgi:antitoxin HigA-1
MPMLHPPHPGRVVRQECLEALDLGATDAAKTLDVTRRAPSTLVKEKAAIPTEMAIWLKKAFGSTVDTCLRMQTAYDPAQARQREDQIQ